MFQRYSQKGCILECSLRFAMDHVGCVPWDFPVPMKQTGDEIPVCHSNYGFMNTMKNTLMQFFDAMNNQSNLRTCECMPDCEAVLYESQESNFMLSPNIPIYTFSI